MRGLGLVLIICLLLVGCGPISQFNTKMQKINVYHSTLENDTSMSGLQKEISYWSEVKKEFPEHANEVNKLLNMAGNIHRKRKDVSARFKNLQQRLDADTKMSNQEKNEISASFIKKEFPEYQAEIDSLVDWRRKISQMERDGLDITQDLNDAKKAEDQFFTRALALEHDIDEYDAAVDAFWEGARYYVRLKNDEYVDGVRYLGDTMSRTGQQINNDAQMRYEGLRNLQQNRPIRCTSSSGYLGTTIYTTCY